MRSAAWIAVVLGVLALAAPASAAPHRGPGGMNAPAGNAERREQIKKKIRAIRAYTLTEELTLDEQTAGRLFPVLARYDDETDRLLEKRVDVQRRLRRADTMRDPRALDRLIDEAVAVQRGFWDLEDRRVTELRKILTPVQTAKLLVVLPALERKIQNQLRKAIVSRRPGARPGADLDDPDDDQQPDEPPAPLPRPPRSRREGTLAPGAPPAPGANPSRAPGNTPPCDPNVAPCR